MAGLYIGTKSGHSRGSTVDMTLIKKGSGYMEKSQYQERYFNDELYPYLFDNSVDCGTSFDLMDPISHGNSSYVSEEHKKMRNYIKSVMERCGFKALEEEWWHFTLKNEPFPDTYFDFPVE